MSAGELDKGEPILRFLGPASTQAAPFGKPAEGAFDDPAASRELSFTWNWTAFKERFIAPTAMFDMGHIAFLLNKVMDIGKVITFIQTQMLLNFSRVRSRHNDRHDHLINQPFVMDVCTRHIHGQGCASAIDQDMEFATPLAAVNWTLARVDTAQRSRARLAVDGLPPPLNASPLLVERDKFTHQALKHTALLPFLKALMKGAAAHAKPFPMHRFPLATRPQHVPNPIDDPSIFRSFAPWPGACPFGRQYPSQSSPQRARHLKIVDILCLLGMILAQDVSVLIGVWLLQSERDISSFATLSSIYG